MKLVAFAASNSRKSINKQLVSYAAGLVEGIEVEVLDLNDYEMPIYSSDREEEDGFPEQAHQFREKIASADGLLISFAEHNGSYTAAYKNIFDWVSRIDRKVYQDKPIVMMAASPGPGGARNVLSTAVSAAPHFGGQVLADISIASFYDAFDSEAVELKDAEAKEKIVAAMAKLVSPVEA